MNASPRRRHAMQRTVFQYRRAAAPPFLRKCRVDNGSRVRGRR